MKQLVLLLGCLPLLSMVVVVTSCEKTVEQQQVQSQQEAYSALMYSAVQADEDNIRVYNEDPAYRQHPSLVAFAFDFRGKEPFTWQEVDAAARQLLADWEESAQWQDVQCLAVFTLNKALLPALKQQSDDEELQKRTRHYLDMAIAHQARDWDVLTNALLAAASQFDAATYEAHKQYLLDGATADLATYETKLLQVTESDQEDAAVAFQKSNYQHIIRDATYTLAQLTL